MASQLGNIGDTIVSIPAQSAVRHHCEPNAVINSLCTIQQRIDANSPHLLCDDSGIAEFEDYKQSLDCYARFLSMLCLLVQLYRKHFDVIGYPAKSQRSQSRIKWERMFWGLCGTWQHISFFAFPLDASYPVDQDGHLQRVTPAALCMLNKLPLGDLEISIDPDFSKAFLKVSREILSKVNG
jgi:hypothetical protein